MKLSRAKVTEPGRKQVFRKKRPFGDVVGLFEEAVPAGREPLLEPLMTGGRRVGRPSTIAETCRRFEADLALLPEAVRRVMAPVPPTVKATERLRRMTGKTRDGLIARLRSPERNLKAT